MWTSSYSCLMDGLKRFQVTSNGPNQALIYANLGSLMASCAQAHAVAHGKGGVRGHGGGGEGSEEGSSASTGGAVRSGEDKDGKHEGRGGAEDVHEDTGEEIELEFSRQERLYYNKAAEFYIKGKQVCGVSERRDRLHLRHGLDCGLKSQATTILV